MPTVAHHTTKAETWARRFAPLPKAVIRCSPSILQAHVERRLHVGGQGTDVGISDVRARKSFLALAISRSSRSTSTAVPAITLATWTRPLPCSGFGHG